MINRPPMRTPLVDVIKNPQGGESVNITKGWGNFFSQVFNICFASAQSGVTADRPMQTLYVGRIYFDTTLGKPIWYNGTGWVDATGASV